MKAKASMLILAMIALLAGSGNVFALGAKGDRMGGKDGSTMTGDHSMKKHDGKTAEQTGSMKEEGTMMNNEGKMEKNEGMQDHTSKGADSGAMNGVQNSEKTDTGK